MTLTVEEHRRAMFALSIAHITDPADNRMKTRTAKEQLAKTLAGAQRPEPDSVPDADAESAKRDRVLT